MKKSENEKINKSKEIIKKEKEKIKEEQKKIKINKAEKFYKTKLGKLFKKIFFLNNKENSFTVRDQIFSIIYFQILGFIFCLLVFFILSGGKNFIKLYMDLSKLINVYDTISSNYYGDLDKDKLIDKAIESMLSGTGDHYTTYTNEQETNNFMENIEGTYEGIGCLVSMNEQGEIIVVNIFDNGPAEKSGLKENDIILSIDGIDYKNKTSEDMSNYVKNNKSKKISLKIRRDDKEQEITIVRELVEIPTVSGQIFEQDDKKIGYINISIFSSVTHDQFKDQLKKLEKEKIKGLIIDVRNNTGGYLSAVTDITSMFLKKGEIIYQLEDNNKKIQIKDKTSEKRDYPIAILVNGSSASASEILTSAIKESYNGLVVGTKTYGKGTVQKTKKLSDGSMIKYTIQKWLTPNGNWIHEKGVEPTNLIEYNSEIAEDNQLQTALELIVKKIK